MATVTMRNLLEAGIHFGHQTRRWDPKMKKYIFGQRNGIYIIDLQHTMRQLQKAYNLVRDNVANGGSLLFVGTKRQAQEAVQQAAERCGMYYMNNRWLGGTLTNFMTVKQSIRKLVELEGMDASGKIDEFTKKEAILMRKDIERLNKNLAGIKNMQRVPTVMFVIDVKKEAIAVREAQRLGIPCIGICDTNADPNVVDIPIPGNDDAIRAINFYCSILADAVLEGRMRGEKQRADAAQKEQDDRAIKAKSAMDDAEEAGEDIEDIEEDVTEEE